MKLSSMGSFICPRLTAWAKSSALVESSRRDRGLLLPCSSRAAGSWGMRQLQLPLSALEDRGKREVLSWNARGS